MRACTQRSRRGARLSLAVPDRLTGLNGDRWGRRRVDLRRRASQRSEGAFALGNVGLLECCFDGSVDIEGELAVERTARPPGFRIRRIVAEAARLAGLKSLYSNSYSTEAESRPLQDREAHVHLKREADPDNALGDRLGKCVRHGR